MERDQVATEIAIIGAGIMGATLGTLLKILEPTWNITIYEKLDEAGKESSNEWSNAGTGHAGLCEVNYTTEKRDKTIDISRAVSVNEQFQVSKQFWSYLVEEKLINEPQKFIRSIPHMSFVEGKDDVEFLNKRHKALIKNPLFQRMEYSENPDVIKEWIPLMMKNRHLDKPIAATRDDTGTDVNFGELTRKMVKSLKNQKGVEVFYHKKVEDIKRTKNNNWELKVHDSANNSIEYHTKQFVFIGAGGATLPLLQKTGIPEGKRIGGFPVSGEFLMCTNQEVINQHQAKVYGKEAPGAPPITMAHLDSRQIGEKKTLLFGPFVGFSPKFLKSGSNFDLLKSVKANNIITMLSAAIKNPVLLKYLAKQLMMSKRQRIQELQNFIPNAKFSDWEVLIAGQRVQVIEDTKEDGRGTLQFGTKLVYSEDCSIAALLGESPGASTSVSVMLNICEQSFPQYTEKWEPKIKRMIPSYGKSLTENLKLYNELNASTSISLCLHTMT